MQKVQGWSENGGVSVVVPGTQGSGSQRFQQSFRGCTISVYNAGTLTLSTIYSDDISTPKANPFTSSSVTGYWFFYAANGRYDVKFSGGGITSPFTLGDFVLLDLESAIVNDILFAFKNPSYKIQWTGYNLTTPNTKVPWLSLSLSPDFPSLLQLLTPVASVAAGGRAFHIPEKDSSAPLGDEVTEIAIFAEGDISACTTSGCEVANFTALKNTEFQINTQAFGTGTLRPLKFRVQSTEVARLDVTSSTFQIPNNRYISGHVAAAGTASQGLVMLSSADRVTLSDGSGVDILGAASSTGVVIKTGGTTQASFDQFGNMTLANGALVIASTSTTAGLISFNNDAIITRGGANEFWFGSSTSTYNGTVDLGDGTHTLRDIFTVRIVGGNGSAGSPSHTFTNFSTTGLYASAGPTLHFAVNGTQMMNMDLFGNISAVQTGISFGVPAGSGFNISGDTFMGRAAAGVVAFGSALATMNGTASLGNSTNRILDIFLSGVINISTAGATIQAASGAPGGACTRGSIYMRTDNFGAGAVLYACENAAWVAK